MDEVKHGGKRKGSVVRRVSQQCFCVYLFD